MNFVFISPHFPHTYWQFCDRLHRNGVNVLGIGDAPYDGLEAPLKAALTEYYRVDSLEDYDQVYRAVAFFAFRYGKIDWIESMNEYWLEQDARLRTDFNVTTGIRSDRIRFIKEKSLMKQLFLDAGIPTARQHVVSTVEAGLEFAEKVGYPLIVKPNIGVGATDTWKLHNDGDAGKTETAFRNSSWPANRSLIRSSIPPPIPCPRYSGSTATSVISVHAFPSESALPAPTIRLPSRAKTAYVLFRKAVSVFPASQPSRTGMERASTCAAWL